MQSPNPKRKLSYRIKKEVIMPFALLLPSLCFALIILHGIIYGL